MARIYLSPLIVDIRNKQKDTVFSKWKGINYIRSRVIPSNPQSAAQTAIRNALAHLVGLWQDSGPEVQDNNDVKVSGRNKSGFNNFIGVNTVDEKDGNTIQVTQDNGYQELNTWTPSTGSGSGEIDVAFAPTPVPAGKRLAYKLRKANTSEWAVQSGWAAATASPQTITGLDAGDTYQVYGYLRVEPYDNDGNNVGKSSAGSAAAQS